MKFRMKTAGLAVIVATVFTACGGGSSSSASGGGGATVALAGVVIDGVIEGASVCLDLNVNLVCDAGEPSATTAANGSYSLSLAGLSTAQIRGAHIITSVPLTAKDADDGGQTLAQAGKAAFNLMSPAEAFVSADGATISSAVVSPLTTLISHEMMGGSGKTAAVAEAAVVTALGLTTGANLRGNFVGQSDASNLGLQKRARFIAAALGQVKGAIGTGASSSSDRDRQLGALNYLKTNATALLGAINSSTATTAAAQLQDAIAALATPSVMPTPVASTLVTQAQAFASASTSMDAVASDWGTVIGAGFYNAFCGSASASTSVGPPSVTTYTCNEWAHSKVSSNVAGQWASEPFVRTNAAWAPRLAANYTGANLGYTLTSTGWKVPNVEVNTGTYVSDGVGGMNVTEDTDGSTVRMRLSIKDISGKTVSDLIGTDTSTDNNALGSIALYLSPSDSTHFKNTVFPAGSKLFAFKSTFNADAYYLWGGTSAQASVVNCTLTCVTTLLTSFADLTTAYATGNSSGQRLSILSNSSPTFPMGFTFDAGGTATGGAMTVWKLNTVSAAWEEQTEKGAYQIRTVSGEKILVIVPPASVIANRTALTAEQIYAVHGGKLYNGNYESMAYRNSRTAAPNWNGAAIGAIMTGAGFPAVLK